MLKQIFSALRELLLLQDQVRRNSSDIKELQEDVRALNVVVMKLINDMQRMQENERHEREKFVLRVENTLLQMEKRLPPSS